MLYTLRMWNGEEEEENKYMWNTWKLWYMKYLYNEINDMCL